MREIFRLAIRNLKEHKSKTIIIAFFLIFGVAIVILGNSFLESVNRGLEKDFRENYTGDIAISTKPGQGEVIDIFGLSSTNISTAMSQIPAINNLDKVMEIVNTTDEIDCSTKLISAKVLVTHGMEVDFSELLDRDDLGFDDMPISMLFAGETETYHSVFPDVHFVEGTYPKPGSNEIIIDARVRSAFESLYRKKLNVGDTLLIAGANAENVIREAKLAGVFDPPNENSAMFQIIYCNPEMARSFADLTYAASFSSDLPEYADFSISSLSEDDLFGSSDFSDTDEEFFDSSFDFGITEDSSVLADSTLDFNSILGDTTLRDNLNKTDDGSWQFVLIKLKHRSQTQRLINEISSKCAEAGLNVQVIGWKMAAASYTGTVDGISFIFNVLIIILAVVVFIVIMNTMTVSVIERTAEIGTMRAIGAEKRFVRLLFFSESFFLTLIFSLIGIVVAFVCMAIFNSLNITITNSIAKMILGGGLLHFSPTFKIIIMTILISLAGSILSNLYPIKSALKITPLKALSKE